jgi:TonB family protein
MLKALGTVFLFFVVGVSLAQNVQTTYYENRSLTKKANAEKAQFVKSVWKNADGSETTEVKKIEGNQVVFSETYFGEEPTGIWTFHDGNTKREFNYDFKLVYGSRKCSDSLEHSIVDPWDNNAQEDYKAPVFATGEKHFFQYLAAKMYYNPLAKEKMIQGRVLVSYKIKKDGTLDEFQVVMGAHVLLDKEAVRVLREMKFSSPAMLKGKPIDLCVKTMVSFRLS